MGVDRCNVEWFGIDGGLPFRQQFHQLTAVEPVAEQPVREQHYPHAAQRGDKQGFGIIGGHQRRDGIVGPRLAGPTQQPAVGAGRAAIDQAFVLHNVVRRFRRAVFAQIGRGSGQMIKLLAQYPGVKRGVGQCANAKDHVGGIPMGIDVIIGQRQLNAEAGVTFRQAGKTGGDVPLAEKHRGVNAHHAGRLLFALIQFTARIVKIAKHLSCKTNKEMPALGRDNGPRIAVEQLLAERILKLVNDAGNLRS